MLMFFNVISVAFEVRNLGCIQDVHVTCRSKSIIENVVDNTRDSSIIVNRQV